MVFKSMASHPDKDQLNVMIDSVNLNSVPYSQKLEEKFVYMDKGLCLENYIAVLFFEGGDRTFDDIKGQKLPEDRIWNFAH